MCMGSSDSDYLSQGKIPALSDFVPGKSFFYDGLKLNINHIGDNAIMTSLGNEDGSFTIQNFHVDTYDSLTGKFKGSDVAFADSRSDLNRMIKEAKA